MVHSAGLHLAVLDALDVAWPRRFSGYPVAGEVRPTEDDVVAVLERRAPTWVSITAGVDLRAQVARHLSVGAWPFGELVASDEPPTKAGSST
jgi:hypothetical protein